MTVAYGDVPLIDPLTGRFPDAFAPPSVAAAVLSTAQDAADAEAARAAAEALTDVTVTTGAIVGNDLILTRTDATTVNAGNVRGATGPANTLTIGTVTTLPAGSSATAGLTGVAPNQTLALGLPNGQPSDWLKVGPGNPRSAATTAGQITGTEPNGCTYRSTDGGGVGGYGWTKRAGVWVCVEGDTGFSYLSSWGTDSIVTGDALPTNWAPTPGTAGYLRIRRVNNRVTFLARGVTYADQGIRSLPAGFRPPHNAIFPVSYWSTTGYGLVNEGAVLLGMPGVVSHVNYPTRAEWDSIEAWPATLPGSPA